MDKNLEYQRGGGEKKPLTPPFTRSGNGEGIGREFHPRRGIKRKELSGQTHKQTEPVGALVQKKTRQCATTG